jgi:hypothetical protein
MSIPAAWPQVPDFFDTSAGPRTIAGPTPQRHGATPIRPFDERVGLTRPFADALDDARARLPEGGAPASRVSWPATRIRTATIWPS